LGENAAHILGGELGVLVDEFETDGLAIDDRQRMALLKSGVALIADVVPAQRFGWSLLINRLRAIVSLPKNPMANAAPPDGRPRMMV